MKCKSALAKVFAGFVHETGGQCKSVCISVFAYTSSGINLFGTIMVRADSCFYS
jgi:hypothetical protein